MNRIKVNTKCRISLMIGLLVASGSELKAESGVLLSDERTVSADSALGDLPLNIQKSLNELKNVEILESAYVGFTEAPSENLNLLRVLLSYGDSEQVLARLYHEGNMVAKMYAIIGLQLQGKSDLAQALTKDAYQYQLESIHAMEGCVIFQRLLQDVLRDITEGYYAKMFTEGG